MPLFVEKAQELPRCSKGEKLMQEMTLCLGDGGWGGGEEMGGTVLHPSAALAYRM